MSLHRRWMLAAALFTLAVTALFGLFAMAFVYTVEDRFFERLLQRHGLSAADTAFVDDHPANIVSARRLGLHAIAFENAAQCRDALRGWLGDAGTAARR